MFRDETVEIADEIRRILPKTLPYSPGLALLMEAVVAAEDRRFWGHVGIDLVGILRALFNYLRHGRVTGASTIEQQLVRTIRRRYEITLARKFSEVVIAVRISRRFSKIEIMNAYLEVAYFGWRANGIRQATERFGIDIGRITGEDALLLASLMKLPMPHNPSDSYDARLQRRIDYVRKRLSER